MQIQYTSNDYKKIFCNVTNCNVTKCNVTNCLCHELYVSLYSESL